MDHGGEHRPKRVCYVDRDGFYVGEEQSIDYLLENPKAAFAASEDDSCDCQDCETEGDNEDIKEEVYTDRHFTNFLEPINSEVDAMILAPNRNELWRLLRFLGAEYKRIHKQVLRSQILMVHMPCGRIYAYKAFDDVPLHSIKCYCDREWVIFYDEYGY